MTFSSLHPFIGQPSISSKVEVLVIVLVLTAIILLAYFFFRHVQFLNQKIYRQEQTIKQRQMLLSNLSHEIRTPLSGIIGMISLLEGVGERESKIGTLESIKLASTHLLDLVNNILDYSKLKEGSLKREKKVFNIERLILNQFKILTIEAERNQVDFELNISPKSERYLKSDTTKISQILLNLLSNAVKFSTGTKIIVYVDTFSQTDFQIKLQIKVKDFGIGIAKSAQRNIFKPFIQAETTTSHEYGGSGLGLAICSQICKLMQGHIWCTSEEGKGSTFGFAIDVIKASKEEYLRFQSQETIYPKDSRKKPRLLLVEDDEVNLKVASRMLDKLGLKHEVARNGAQALKKAQGESFDIIFMDINLPLLDGFETAMKIKLAYGHKQLKIIAMTARSMVEIEDSLSQSEMDDYLLKPFSIDKLEEKISKHMPL